MWLEPGIFASILSPKERSCEGCALSSPISFLIYSAWAVKSHSVPSLSPLVQSKSSSFLPCSLAKKAMFSPASLNGFSSLLPIYFPARSLSSHRPSSPALPWLPVPDFGADGSSGAAAGLPGRALPWRVRLFPDAFSHPREPLTFLLPLDQICSFFTLCRVWSSESWQPSPCRLQLFSAVSMQHIYL